MNSNDRDEPHEEHQFHDCRDAGELDPTALKFLEDHFDRMITFLKVPSVQRNSLAKSGMRVLRRLEESHDGFCSERLVGGKITAIDRSEVMVDMARRRNRRHVSSGKAVFQTVALDEADFGNERFDKIFAFNVGLFWKQSAKEMGIIKKLLTPAGVFTL